MITGLTKEELKICELAIGIVNCLGIINTKEDLPEGLVKEAEEALELFRTRFDALFDSHPNTEAFQAKLRGEND